MSPSQASKDMPKFEPTEPTEPSTTHSSSNKLSKKPSTKTQTANPNVGSSSNANSNANKPTAPTKQLKPDVPYTLYEKLLFLKADDKLSQKIHTAVNSNMSRLHLSSKNKQQLEAHLLQAFQKGYVDRYDIYYIVENAPYIIKDTQGLLKRMVNRRVLWNDFINYEINIDL